MEDPDRMPDPAEDPVEAERMAGHYSTTGPVKAVYGWLDCVIADDFAEAWQRMDDNLRLCRAQAWIWNNRTHPYFAAHDLDVDAGVLAQVPSTGPIWDDFAATELEQLLETWDDFLAAYQRGHVGAASASRAIGPDLEVVILQNTGGNVVVYDDPTLIADAFVFTVRLIESDWKVAAYTDYVPTPGWPPELERPAAG